MAGYCDQTDLVSRFGEQELIQLTDRNNSGAIDATTVAAAIEGAVADINSYIGRWYTLPLPSTPDVLRDKCEVLTRYRLYENGASDQVRQDYEDAIRWLIGVREGKNTLGINTDDTSMRASGRIAVKSRLPVFTESLMEKYG